MKRIPLSARSHPPTAFALVDDDDYPFLSGQRWSYTGRRGCEYAIGSVDGRMIPMHRVILGLTWGDGIHVDHINRNGLDNRRANLRVGDAALNGQNRPGHANSTSPYRGVSYIRQGSLRKRWRAQVRLDGKPIHVGVYMTEIEAALAAEAYRREHMPFSRPDSALTTATARISLT